ncbi:MarR family winged helix-turn-helix transcriptional regulator [Arthrobacter sp. NPDC090010]|uniref:MarR family winged helix-turn-helix transcriptional regulator n=1 Tax=Arthrobacter sp. NPDC090010 TaxID=3363942 RepID=UPI0037F5BB78
MSESSAEESGVSGSLYHVDVSDPRRELVDTHGLTGQDLAQINALMDAMASLRNAERLLSDASRSYMKLNESDMRALHYLIGAENQGRVATPGAIAAHLGISSAATTKLLDRLERGGHVVRGQHPQDRRALAITVTPDTRTAAMSTVGRQQARRFGVAAQLSSAERETVTRFLLDTAREITPSADGWASTPGGGER